MEINKNVKKAVIGTVSVSIMASACSPYFSQQDDDSLYLETNTSFDLGEVAVPITINLSKEQRDYLLFLQKLSKDIIEQPVIAKEFAKNPELFIQRYGYNEPVDLDEGMLKMVVALGDEDINRAIKSNDIKLFYNLCKEKNLLRGSKTKFNFAEPSYEMIKQLQEHGITLTEEDIQSGIAPVGFISVFEIWVDLIYYQYVGVFTEEYAFAQTEWWGTVKKSNADLLMEENPTINIWALKDHSNDTYIIANEIIENQVDDIMDILKTEEPTILENNNEEDLRNFIKINLYK